MTDKDFWRGYDDLPLLLRLPIMFVAYCLVALVASIPLMFMLLLRPFSIGSANVRTRRR